MTNLLNITSNPKKEKKNQGIFLLVLSQFFTLALFTISSFLQLYLLKDEYIGRGQKITLPKSHPYFHFINETFIQMSHSLVLNIFLLASLMILSTVLIVKILKRDSSDSSNVIPLISHKDKNAA
jgi:hypothetical protein